MKNRFFAINLAIIVMLLVSCEDELHNEYIVSESLKELIDYGNIGTEWVYDVNVNKEFRISTRHFISDTVIKGEISEIKNTTILNVITEDKRILDTTLFLRDSVFLFGEYRIFEDSIYIRDTINIKRPPSARYTEVIREAWDPSNDDDDSTSPDSLIFEYFYTISKIIPPASYTDTMYISDIQTGSFDLKIRNKTSTENFHKTIIKSKLDNDVNYIETVSATSSGYQYYRRDEERIRSYTKTLELAFNNEGMLDTMQFSQESGIAVYDEVGTIELNGNTYENVIKIISNFSGTDFQGNRTFNNVEFWYIEGFGMIKIDNKTEKIIWTLK